MDYPHVPADVVAQINELPRERLARVAQFAHFMERERLKQHGAKPCAGCGALFVPAQGTVWAEKGYCSKMCFVQAEGAAAMEPLTET